MLYIENSIYLYVRVHMACRYASIKCVYVLCMCILSIHPSIHDNWAIVSVKGRNVSLLARWQLACGQQK